MPHVTIAECVDEHASRQPDHLALVSPDGCTRTYAELSHTARALARSLTRLGAAPGDRIAALVDDGIEYVELYIAAARLGAVVVPINTRLTPAEASVLVADCTPRILVWSANHSNITSGLPVTDAVSVVIGAIPDDAPIGTVRFDTLVREGGTLPQVTVAVDADDAFIIGYTSGTTGRPKGAVMTHRSVAAIAESNNRAYRLPERSVCALTGSMSFVATVPAHVLTHLRFGGMVVILGKWSVPQLIDIIERYRVTFTYIPSPLIDQFAGEAASSPTRIASLRSVLHSASKAGPDKLRTLYGVLGDTLIEGLGMTENSGGLVTATRPGDFEPTGPAADPFASVGRSVEGTELKVVDENGAELPRDGSAIGEIIVRSSSLMRGYWNMPEATAAALVDGWYHTGDLGSIDAAGFVYVSDRRTDLIVSGGMNVYPSEVESTVAGHPAVAECAVVGAPHPRWGQSVVAVVALHDGAALTLAELQDHCRRTLASYKKPTRLEIVESLPRTTSLKVRRNVVRDLVLSG
ncbi:AMP-binding protein [Rhodococcus sp. A14]|jgi:acyl-CoA synthetase (AMP-forming)/AMP-acid ligase II|uniref:AMP-binding protein n=1 Tax=Rhodococcus sp. A14 TaxID=1194106 RepID=UPI00141F46FF|nr:AMP-binding protein [Rhodococcus sp. A14]